MCTGEGCLRRTFVGHDGIIILPTVEADTSGPHLLMTNICRTLMSESPTIRQIDYKMWYKLSCKSSGNEVWARSCRQVGYTLLCPSRDNMRVHPGSLGMTTYESGTLRSLYIPIRSTMLCTLLIAYLLSKYLHHDRCTLSPCWFRRTEGVDSPGE